MNMNATGVVGWATCVFVVAASTILLSRPVLAVNAVAVAATAARDREELAHHSRFYRMLQCKTRNLRLSQEQAHRVDELEKMTVHGLGWLRQLHAIDETLPSSAENPHATQRAALIRYFDQILTEEILEPGQTDVLIWGC